MPTRAANGFPLRSITTRRPLAALVINADSPALACAVLTLAFMQISDSGLWRLLDHFDLYDSMTHIDAD